MTCFGSTICQAHHVRVQMDLHCFNYDLVSASRCQCCQARWDSPVPPLKGNKECKTALTGLHQNLSPLPFLWFWLSIVLATHLQLIKFPPLQPSLQNLLENIVLSLWKWKQHIPLKFVPTYNPIPCQSPKDCHLKCTYFSKWWINIQIR